MKALFIAMAVLAGSLAQADGFRCVSESGLNIKVYNHTSPSMGTRSAAVMVISDANVGLGNKTIASFSDVKGTLKSQELSYMAKVDLRVLESNRKGELIGGTKLGYIDTIVLDIDFTYTRPLADGEKTEALLSITKRDGTLLHEDATCTRYLKN